MKKSAPSQSLSAPTNPPTDPHTSPDPNVVDHVSRIRRTSTRSIPFGPYTPPRPGPTKSSTPLAWFVFTYRNGRTSIGRLTQRRYRCPASSDMAALAKLGRAMRPRPCAILCRITRASADFDRLFTMALTPTPAVPA